MRVLIFGTGVYYERCRHLFSGVEVLALLDNDLKKQGKFIDGIVVKSVEEGLKLPYERVFVLSSKHAYEMRKQLLKLGTDEKKIFDIWELKKGLLDICPENNGMETLDRNHDSNKRAVFIIPYLPLGGGPIATFLLAKSVKRRGYQVTVISWLDGPLKEEMMKSGIEVKIDSKLCCKDIDDIVGEECLDNNKNNIIFGDGIHIINHMFSGTRNRVPTMLWLHAGECAYTENGKDLNDINLENVYIYSVGRLPAEAFIRRVHKAHVSILRYGIEDNACYNKQRKNGKYTYALIGLYQRIKGQDLYLDAIDMLEPTCLAHCSFLLIGKEGDDATYNQKIHEKVEELVRSKGVDIREIGELNRQEVLNAYQDIDVLVTPSREDAMPAVCTEAAMNSCCIICSKDTGFSEFIIDCENGLVFNTGAVNELAKKMQYVYDNKEHAQRMGRELRRIYEKEFSMPVFERHVKSMLETIIG